MGTGKICKGMGSATCTYSVDGSKVYTAKKFKTIKFCLALYEGEGENAKLVAKVC